MSTLLRERWLPWVLAIGLTLRVAVACWPVFHHPDELWQYLEPARHVGGKPWIMTWEARAGARGWLMPVLFAGPMALGQWLAPGTFLPVLAARMLCVAISLAAMFAAAGLGFRISRLHGLVAAIVAATWYEWAYFSARTLTEPIATALILLAAWLLHDRRRRTVMVAGGLLALAVTIRFPYAPAVFVLAAWTVRADWRAWGWLTVGAVAGLAVSGLADLAMGATPLVWVVRNLALNLVDNRSAAYGTSPPWWYAVILWQLWGVTLVPILILAAIGARRYPALAIAALVNLAVHAAIGHKEERFIFLTTSIAMLLAAMGSVDLAVRRRWRHPAVVLGAAWLALSAAGSVRMFGPSSYRPIAAVWRAAAAVSDLCGVGLLQTHPLLASQVLLARDKPIYHFEERSLTIAARSRAFNALIFPLEYRAVLPGFRTLSCTGDGPGTLCVAVRSGPCVTGHADARFDANRALERSSF